MPPLYPGPAILRGTFANRPTAGVAGRTYLCTDSPLSFYDSGAAWQPFLAKTGLTSTPAAASFTQVNAGGRSTSLLDSVGGLLMSNTNGANAVDYRFALVATPTPPYTLTVHVYPMTGPLPQPGVGLAWRDSVSGGVVNFGVITATSATGSNLMMVRNSTASAGPTYAFSSDVVTPLAAISWYGDGLWLRIKDDSANRLCSYSLDGINFFQVSSTIRSSFITANQLGLWIGNTTTAGSASASCAAFFSSYLLN